MIRRTILLGASLGLAACATTDSAYVPNYLEQAPVRQSFATPLEVAETLVGQYPESLEGGPTMDLAFAPIPARPDRFLLTVSVEPLLDDSVSAQQWETELRRDTAGRWHMVTLGLRQKCARGANPDEWVAQLCP